MAIASDQRNEEVFSTLKQINNDLRQALSEESTSVRVHDLLTLYRRTEERLGRPEASPLIAAALRFRAACDVSAVHTAQGLSLTADEIAEIQDATVGLIFATNTTSLEASLEVLSEFES